MTRPILRPTPHDVDGVDRPVRPIAEGWRFHPAPGTGFWEPSHDSSGWAPVEVPGEPAMQGFDVEQDVEMGYRTEFAAPAKGLRTVLRFEGVYSFARVWINGVFAGEHLGGFTRFEFDVTDLVRPGESNLLAVGVTDRADSVSTASSYAFHLIGGILRPVELITLPAASLIGLHIATNVESFETGQARLGLGIETSAHAAGATLRVELRGPEGAVVRLDDAEWMVPASSRLDLDLDVGAVRLWSDETPVLYELAVTVLGERSVTTHHRVGFRAVAVEGNRLLVNGRSVELRGVNHHDLDPLLGRSSDGTLAARDLALYKQANINFVRTSHYPPHPALLDAADELGIYVEVENGVCWAGQFGWPATQDDERFLPEYIGPLAEMIERDRNHASVVIWSLGNESTWGDNFRLCHEFATDVDPSRPTIMSFEGGPEHILSSHYPAYGTDLASSDKPLLYDEVVHCPVYQSGDLRRDPAIHADWAASISSFMADLRAADGALGIAIWSGVDEVFDLPGGRVGFGPWGIIDVWRRRKPEWWATRSAYNPIRVTPAAMTRPDRPFAVEARNGLTFSSLADYEFRWSGDGRSHIHSSPDAAPGDVVVLEPPHFDGAASLHLTIVAPDGRIVDELEFDVPRAAGSPAHTVEETRADAAPPAAPMWRREGGIISIGDGGMGFRIDVDEATGRIVRGVAGDREVLCDGLDLHLAGAIITGDRSVQQVTVTERTGSVVVSVEGAWGERVDGFIRLEISGSGVLRVTYRVDAAPGAVEGRISETGLTFDLTADADLTHWESGEANLIAGDGFLGRSRGSAPRAAAVEPRQLGDDAVSWNYVRTGGADRSFADAWSRDFRARRDRVTTQRIVGAAGAGVELSGRGETSTRLFAARNVIRPDDARVAMVGPWRREAVLGGLNQGAAGLSDHRVDEAGAVVAVRFDGDGIDCIGALGPDLGIVDIELDGQVAAESIDLFSPVDCSGHCILSAHGLGEGAHELRIVSTGNHHPSSTGAAVRIQSFEVYEAQPCTRLAIISDYAYPVSGSFDWMDPAVIRTGADGFTAAGDVTLRLLPPRPSMETPQRRSS